MKPVQLRAFLLTTVCAVSALLSVQAADDKKVDPTGTWAWTQQTQNGEARETTLKLKKEGDKLMGTISGRDGAENPIEEVKLDKDQLTFQVTRERNGNKFTTKYMGKVSEDSIKGKREMPGRDGGEPRSIDWEAKKKGGKPASNASNVSGKYKYSIKINDDLTLEPVLTLKQEADKVTGTVMIRENESPISDVKLKDNEITFKTIRERNGEKFTTTYTGKIEGDSIKGKIQGRFGGGEERSMDWEAKKSKD